MPISEQDIILLKKPFGKLIENEKLSKEVIEKYIIMNHNNKIITVGDATTEKILSYGIFPNLMIIDGKERRKKREIKNIDELRSNPYLTDIQEIKCSNPAGTITEDAVNIIKTILSSSKTYRIVVDGEEDLLALPIFAFANNSSVVMYGQPLEGMVIVKIDRKIREKAMKLLDRIGFG